MISSGLTGIPLNTDPRPALVRKRLTGIGRVIVFASGKGGVGKSSCSCAATLLLAKQGYKTGLLDMDFQGASDHLIIGADSGFPEEDRGILPQALQYGLRFMSISFFSGEHGVPLRGAEVTQAFLELMAVTVWDNLNYLVIDMPPGIGDEILDVLRFIPKSEIIVVSTPSLISGKVVQRLVEVLVKMRTNILGVLENMNSSGSIEYFAETNQIPYLGAVPFIQNLERFIGEPEALVSSRFGNSLSHIITRISAQTRSG